MAVTTSAPSPCQNCESTTTPVKVPYSTVYRGGPPIPDFGKASYSTSLSGFTTNTTASDGYSLGLPTIGGVTCSVSSILSNATLSLLQCPNMNEYFKPIQNQVLITLQGTMGSATQVSLPLTAIGQPAICDSAPHTTTGGINGSILSYPACTKACFGNACFDWSDMTSFNPSYDNASHILTFTIQPGPFLIDPLAIDGVATICSSASGANHTCNTTVTTSNTNDVIIVQESMLVLSVSYCQLPTAIGVTFHLRQTTTASGTVFDSCEYYTTWSSSGSLTVTCSWNNPSSGATSSCAVFGISGADTSTIFDSNTNAKCTAGNNNAGPATCNVSTSNANDMIIGLGAGNTVITYTHGTGFSLIQASCTNVLVCDQEQVVSSTQTNLAVSMTLSASEFWTMLGDSIIAVAATSTQGIKITTLPGGAPSATITITGCAPSNSTFTANGNTHTYTLTASCTVTLAEPADGTHTRYRFNVSPKPTAATSITFGTCASGTCSLYSNNTYYQLGENWTLTAQTPSTFDGVYSTSITGTFLGSGSHSAVCASTAAGQATAKCTNVYFDYNTQSCAKTPLGNSWNAVLPNCFTQTTANNVNVVNYVQSKATSVQSDPWAAVIILLLFISISTFAMLKMNRRGTGRP